jgi:hypothetical protein
MYIKYPIHDARLHPEPNLSLAYVLDLCVRLPPSRPTPFTASCHWRTYALRLEIELKQFQEQHEVQKTSKLTPFCDQNTLVLIATSKNYLPSQMAPLQK